MTPRAIIPAIATIVGSIGCSDPLAFEDLAGTYALTGIDARPLPQLLTATLNCDEWVRGGDLSLQPSGQFILTVRGELDCTRVGGQVQALGWEYPGTFTVSGTRLQFLAPSYTSSAIQFTGQVDPWRRTIEVSQFELHQSKAVDLEFRR